MFGAGDAVVLISVSQDVAETSVRWCIRSSGTMILTPTQMLRGRSRTRQIMYVQVPERKRSVSRLYEKERCIQYEFLR